MGSVLFLFCFFLDSGSLWHPAQHEDNGQHLGARRGALDPHIAFTRLPGSLQHLLSSPTTGGSKPKQPPLRGVLACFHGGHDTGPSAQGAACQGRGASGGVIFT